MLKPMNFIETAKSLPTKEQSETEQFLLLLPLDAATGFRYCPVIAQGFNPEENRFYLDGKPMKRTGYWALIETKQPRVDYNTTKY